MENFNTDELYISSRIIDVAHEYVFKFNLHKVWNCLIGLLTFALLSFSSAPPALHIYFQPLVYKSHVSIILTGTGNSISH